MCNRSLFLVVTLASAVLLSAFECAWGRGGGGGHGGGGGGHGGGGAGFGGGGHFGGAGWGGRGFGTGGFRGYGWGGYRGYGYGWGYPGYGYGLGYGLGVGLGYGLYGGYGGYGYGGYGYGGYGGYGYGGYGYGYPGYGSYGYDPYAAGYDGAYGPSQYNGSSNVSNPPATAPANSIHADSSTLKGALEFGDKGEAAFRTGDYKSAVYALRHAVVDDPNNAVVTLLLGQALFATGDYDEAAGATQAAMRQLTRERWGVVISHYTELYADTKDYTRQLRALEKAVKEQPEKPALRFLAGFHYAYLGFKQQAIEQLDKAVSLAPRDEMARQLRDELRGKLTKPSVAPAPPAPGLPSGPEIDPEE